MEYFKEKLKVNDAQSWVSVCARACDWGGGLCMFVCDGGVCDRVCSPGYLFIRFHSYERYLKWLELAVKPNVCDVFVVCD